MIFIYFAAIAPAITFGGLLGERSNHMTISQTSWQCMVFVTCHNKCDFTRCKKETVTNLSHCQHEMTEKCRFQ